MGYLIYTCVMLIHNFGAVTVVGSPAMALWLVSLVVTPRLRMRGNRSRLNR
jgi:hypothetical protein